MEDGAIGLLLSSIIDQPSVPAAAEVFGAMVLLAEARLPPFTDTVKPLVVLVLTLTVVLPVPALPGTMLPILTLVAVIEIDAPTLAVIFAVVGLAADAAKGNADKPATAPAAINAFTFFTV